MNASAIVLQSESPNRNAIIPASAEGNTKHRLEYFVKWLDDSGQRWINPDLAAYRDYLMSSARLVPGKAGEMKPSPLSPASAQAHLATIRGRYTSILESNTARDDLYRIVAADTDSAADRKAKVDELLIRLENATKPSAAKVEVIKSQDRIDADHLRLTKEQADALLEAPRRNAHNTPLQALRDSAMIALMLCTGIREMELCNLDVKDLRQKTGGELVLHVRKGKGAKERTIPYGALDWSLLLVERWLQAAGIVDGNGQLIESAYVLEPKPGIRRPDKRNPDHWQKAYPVFRGFYKNGKSIRPGRLTLRAVNQVMDKYPITIDGARRVVNPHDCRRTYARRLYEAQFDPVRIQQNLGHSDLKTTLHYIGALDMKLRRPPAIYSQPDLSQFADLL